MSVELQQHPRTIQALLLKGSCQSAWQAPCTIISLLGCLMGPFCHPDRSFKRIQKASPTSAIEVSLPNSCPQQAALKLQKTTEASSRARRGAYWDLHGPSIRNS